MALASANEIDKLPKEHIRRLARVVLGNDCRGDSPYVGIREYTYHPDFFKDKLTLLGNIEYSCMDIQAQYISRRHTSRPKLTLRRWCAEQPNPVCLAGVQFIELFFYVEISFESGFKFRLSAYGEETKIIDSLRAHKYRNTKTHYPKRPKIRELWPVLKKLSATNLFYRKPNYKTSNNDNAIWITYGGKILYMETSP
ncbi:hypothetical protein HF086_011099 [Spodoptera exigua]|uniref:Uncharacterized protein n=1 Tax=Spodoptera exigua TaxID=7107 RepID=A0A922MFZ5_SPOEX|nr:hypothetical protein HF086_011099 [Spodoptera exigua]